MCADASVVGALDSHSMICIRTLCTSAFCQLQEAVKADARLRTSLVSLLKDHTIPAAAALLLPAHVARALTAGWPVGPSVADARLGGRWRMLANATYSLTCAALQDIYLSQLSGSKQAAASLWKLVLALAKQLPPHADESVPELALCSSWIATGQLMHAARVTQRAQHERPLANALSQKAMRESGWALLRLCPSWQRQHMHRARRLALKGAEYFICPCWLSSFHTTWQTWVPSAARRRRRS
jgi:hypothetical protein